jgi:hypothetical protein
MATDAAKKELDGLLNAGRQACESLQIAGSSSLTAIGLTKKLLLVPRLVADWKQSSARGGARTALTLAKDHYPEMDLDLITFGIPESGEDGAPVDEAAIRQSVLGYDAWLMTSPLGTPRGRCAEYSSKIFPQLRNQGLSFRRGETNN